MSHRKAVHPVNNDNKYLFTMQDTVLSRFHPLISNWFLDRIGQPTQAQEKAWPHIMAGENVLVTAPTGSGKTLTAFLWAIHQLISGEWETGQTRVLYISPLKALNNDVQRNLITPIAELSERFSEAGLAFPEIQVLTRSGDSTQAERRQILKQAPEILITTPESLNLLLSSKGGRTLLNQLQSVILDEIHAVLDSRRGVHLITAVDRLVALSGEFQRIALSATVRPLETTAAFVGGFYRSEPGDITRGPARPIITISADDRKAYRIDIHFPTSPEADNKPDSIWDTLVPRLKDIIARNRSTLLFTNSRRLCEKITYLLNRHEEQPLAYAHHGSLSREIRREVELKLKNGILKAIVATSSLELGIDIGELDEVVLIQSPFSIAATIQKIGRAGHQVGGISSGTIFPTFSFDILQAAVLHAGVHEKDIEPIVPVECPLDILAQIIVSMTGAETRNVDDLYTELISSYPYRNLREDTFHLVLNMLAGRYANSRIRELKPRVSLDWLERTVSARKGAQLALYMSGGTIPDRGYYNLRHHNTHVRIGELDEEFVWEANIGKTFTLGTQNWRVERITHNDVFVTPGPPNLLDMPFWKSEVVNRGFYLSNKIGEFMEVANEQIHQPDFRENVRKTYQMDETSSRLLTDFLKNQKKQTHADLPHRHHILVEYINRGPDSSPANQVALHTLWGGQLNRPYALALEAAWEEKYGQQLEVFPGNNCIILMLPHNIDASDLLSMVKVATFQTLLKKRLEHSGFFAARFRECASRALLITRNRINERMPLWMSRMRSQKLMDSVMPYDDFPILLETWRSCLQDEFDLPALQTILDEIEAGAIRWTAVTSTNPSPLAFSVSWDQINTYMYQEDQPVAGKSSNLRESLISEIAGSPDLRPSLSPDLIGTFEEKRHRIFPGYTPHSARDLVDWVKERLLIPESEWQALLQAMNRDLSKDAESIQREATSKLAIIQPTPDVEPLVVACEFLPRIMDSLYQNIPEITVESIDRVETVQPVPSKTEETGMDPTVVLGEWLQFYGPRTADFISRTLGIPLKMLQPILTEMIESRLLVSGQLVLDGSHYDICDRDNFEILLRLGRRAAIPVFEPLPHENLPLFLARFQGLTQQATDIDGFFRILERLLCLSLQSELWESEIFPARVRDYDPAWMDTVIREGSLNWIGTDRNRIALYLDGDLALLHGAKNETEDRKGKTSRDTTSNNNTEKDISALFPAATGRYSFSELITSSHSGPSELSESLWQGIWQGRVGNDTFSALRTGIKTRFKAPKINPPKNRTRRHSRLFAKRAGFQSWKSAVPFAGNWFLLEPPEVEDGLIAEEELKKERVRLLLDRYGILFRQLLIKELPAFNWSSLFRSLRLMELSGEILSGLFFNNIPGPQFISHEAFHLIQQKQTQSDIYWLTATDPASLCGLQLKPFRTELPKRLTGNHLVYHGTRLVMISERQGKEITFRVDVDDPNIPQYLGPLQHLLYRNFQPKRKIPLETINGVKASESPFLDALRISFEIVTDAESVSLYRKLD